MDEEFNIDCSDEEFADCRGPWNPSSEEIYKMYMMMAKGELPELQFKSPGYKSPTPELQTAPEDNVNESKPDEDKSDFDFLEDVTLPKLKMRKDGEDALKGSAKKKTTSLDSIISNMRRHKLLPAQSKEQ